MRGATAPTADALATSRTSSVSVPRTNHSPRAGSTSGSKTTLRRVTPPGAAGGVESCARCSRCTMSAPVGAAERERGAVVLVALGKRLEAEPFERVVKPLEPDDLQRSHRRDVERAGERGTHADESLEVAIVILRHVHPALGGDRERTVIDERCGREESLVDGERVEEGLQGRSGLTLRHDAVDLGRRR